MTEPTIRTITQAKALAALANPHRARILDALRVDGPSTASMLAHRTGQAVGSASHHLKVLAEAGLVEQAPELAKDRRERWWRLANSGFRWSAAELDDDEAVGAARAAELLQAERQADRTRAWLSNADATPEWEDAAMASQTWLRLTPDELRELHTELLAVLTRWHEDVDADAAVRRDDPETEPVLVFLRGFPSHP